MHDTVTYIYISMSGCQLMSKDGDWYESYEDVPVKLQNQMRPFMFPPTSNTPESYHLDRW